MSCSNPHSYSRPIHHQEASLLVGNGYNKSWLLSHLIWKTLQNRFGSPFQPFPTSRPCQDWCRRQQPLRRWHLSFFHPGTKEWLSKPSIPPTLTLPQLLPLATISFRPQSQVARLLPLPHSLRSLGPAGAKILPIGSSLTRGQNHKSYARPSGCPKMSNSNYCWH